jgi:hypothetical protein
MIDGAGCREHHIGAVIMRREIGAEMDALEAAYALGRTEDRPPHGLIGEGCLLHEVEHHVIGRIHRCRDLLQDHVALAGKLGAVEARRKDDVAQDVERKRQILAQHTGVIGGGIDAGRGVELAADRLDLLGDVPRAPSRRPLEGHMLKEVGDAMLAGLLAPAAGTDPEPKRYGLDLSHGVTDHRQAIGKL